MTGHVEASRRSCCNSLHQNPLSRRAPEIGSGAAEPRHRQCSTNPLTLRPRTTRRTAPRSISRPISPTSKRAGCWCASTARSTRTPSCIRWCAGSSSAASPRTTRRAFLFTNVVDAKGKRYDMPVVVGALAASPEIYAVGMGRKVEEIGAGLDAGDRQSDPAGHGRHGAVPGGRDHRRRAARPGGGPRSAAGAGVDAGLRRRALSHRDAVHHPRSRKPASRTWGCTAPRSKRPTGSRCAWWRGEQWRRRLLPLAQIQRAARRRCRSPS